MGRPALPLRALLRDLGGTPTVVMVTACAVLAVSHYRGSVSWFNGALGARFASHPIAGILPYLWWFGASGVLYLGVPLLVSRLARLPFTRRYGLGVGDWRAGLSVSAVLLAVMLPAVFLAERSPQFHGQYPLAGHGAVLLHTATGDVVSGGVFAIYEAGYCLYFVAWEFLFRGWMLNALLPRMGRAAILVQTVPFVLMHLGKPELEAYGSILAGIALGILALRARSFWYGAALHSAVAVAMDVLSVWPHLRSGGA